MKYLIFLLVTISLISCAKEKCANAIIGEYETVYPISYARIDFTETHQIVYFSGTLAGQFIPLIEVSRAEYTIDCKEFCGENGDCEGYSFDGTILEFDGGMKMRKL